MNPLATLRLSEDVIDLGDSLVAVLEIEAAAPFTVKTPSPLLSEGCREFWIVTPLGKPKTQPMIDGLERWTQQYKLEPRKPGNAIVEFASFTVIDGQGDATALNAEGKAAKIITTLTTESKLRELTGPERLPGRSENSNSAIVPFLLISTSLLVLLIAVVRRILNVKSPIVESVDDAMQKIASQESDREFAAALSRFIREKVFVGVPPSSGLIATQRPPEGGTPTKIDKNHPDAAFNQQSLSTDEIAALSPGPLVDLLRRCDHVLFAGDAFKDGERLELLAAARELTASAVANPAIAPKPTP